jgi:cell division FtsZ-interacting protein ZapD
MNSGRQCRKGRGKEGETEAEIKAGRENELANERDKSFVQSIREDLSILGGWSRFELRGAHCWEIKIGNWVDVKRSACEFMNNREG